MCLDCAPKNRPDILTAYSLFSSSGLTKRGAGSAEARDDPAKFTI